MNKKRTRLKVSYVVGENTDAEILWCKESSGKNCCLTAFCAEVYVAYWAKVSMYRVAV